MKHAIAALVLFSLAGCEKPDARLATAEAFIDAFYSFDAARLDAALESAPGSKPELLFYQGWAEGGHYAIVKRGPCVPVIADTLACPITVKDDLMAALGIDFDVTDTFTLKFTEGKLVAVTTSSNDPQAYHDAKKWVTENRPDLVAKACEGIWNGGPTPGDCVRGMVAGFAQFAAQASPAP